MKNFVYFIIFVSAILVTRIFFIDIVSVSSYSMIPTLEPGEWVVINKVSDIKKGDLVTFYNDDSSQIYIKRVVAVPGDKVLYKDDIVIINNIGLVKEKKQLSIQLPNELKERNFKAFSERLNDIEYIVLVDQDKVTHNSKELILGENEYYVLGDNRNHSKDSRDFGAVTKNKVIGKAILR